MDSVPLVVAFLSEGFALGGVSLKAAIDRVENRNRSRREDYRRFEDIRLQSIIEFLQVFRETTAEAAELHQLALRLAADPQFDGDLPYNK